MFDSNSRTSWKYFLLIAASIGVVYLQTLQFDFVNYDDYDLIYENESYISDVSNIFNSFTTHAFTSHRKESVYYRPILLISYIIDYRFWGLNPAGYHLTNILLHCITALFIFLLIELLTRNKLIALFSTLLFALHPLQVEAVAWIAGRNDVLLGLFIVLMIYFYIQHHAKPEKGKLYFTLSILSFTFALFTKESAAFYIFLLPLYDVVIKRDSLRSLFSSSTFIRYSIPLVVLIGYMFIRLNIFGEFIGVEKLYGKLSFYGRLRLLPLLFTEHLNLLLFPFRLCIEHPLDNLIWLDPPWKYFAWFITIVFIVAIGVAAHYNSRLSFGLLFLFVGLLPTLNIFPVAVPILEHRLYTPLIGFSILVITILLSEQFVRKSKIGIVFILLILGFATFGSLQRLPIWKNSEALWLDAINKAPQMRRSYFNLAGHYFDKQEYGKTVVILNKYIELNPNDFMGYSKLRQTYFLMGLNDEAVNVCRKMIAMDSTSQSRYVDLAMLYEHFNLLDSALKVYNEALSIDSNFYEVHDKLGTIYKKLNRSELAIYHYKRSFESKPDYAQAYFNLGNLYATLGENQDALQILKEGMKYGNPTEEIQNLYSKLQKINKNITFP
ncbi:MAG: tetratricopeptide repeat protein [Bacteroidota bacterium]|nr:tetratricopeptide repeat protein [Bacteroidota bacterium]